MTDSVRLYRCKVHATRIPCLGHTCLSSPGQVFLLGKKTVSDTLCTAKLLLDHGLRELINEPDSLGNTPLHALIAR